MGMPDSSTVSPISLQDVVPYRSTLSESLSSSGEHRNISDLRRRLKEVEEQAKIQKAAYESLSASTSSLALEEFDIRAITKMEGFFREEKWAVKGANFNEFSKFMIRKIDTPNEFGRFKSAFTTIFNNLFNHEQLNRHLHNLLAYVDAVRMGEKGTGEIVATQLSLLTTDKLKGGAYCSEGLDEVKGPKLLWWTIKYAKDNQTYFQKSLNRFFVNFKGKSILDTITGVITGELKNQIVAAEMLSAECPNSIYEASCTSNSIMQRYMVSAAMLPNVAKPAALVMPTTFSALRKCYLYHWRSTPIEVPPLAQYGNNTYNSFFIGREEIFEKCLSIWNQKRHVLLVGNPGTGKSIFMNELGYRIANGLLGDFTAEALYGGSAVQLSGQDMTGQSPFQRVIKILSRYGDRVALSIDEAQAFDEDNLTRLLTATDNVSPESLRFCILATTPEGYTTHFANNQALNRRFEKVELNSLGETELIHLLSWEAKEMSPYITINHEAMKLLYHEVNGDQNKARLLLRRVLTLADKKSSGDIDDLVRKRDSISSEIGLCKHNHVTQNDSLMENYNDLDKNEEKESELGQLIEKLEQKRERRGEHIKLIDRLRFSKIRKFEKAMNLSRLMDNYDNGASSGLDKERLLTDKKFEERYKTSIDDLIFSQFFHLPHEVQRIRSLEDIHGFMSVVDRRIMQEFLAETSAIGLNSSNVEVKKSEINSSSTSFLDPLSIPGLNFQKIKGDGSCFFNSVSIYLQIDQEQLRRVTAAHIEHNLEKFRDSINLAVGQTLDEYLNDLRSGTGWADHVEIVVIMQLLDRPIYIIGPDGNLRNKQDIDDLYLQEAPIFVFYNGHNHYDAFVLDGTKPVEDIVAQLVNNDNPSSRSPVTVSKRSLDEVKPIAETSREQDGLPIVAELPPKLVEEVVLAQKDAEKPEEYTLPAETVAVEETISPSTGGAAPKTGKRKRRKKKTGQ